MEQPEQTEEATPNESSSEIDTENTLNTAEESSTEA